MPVEAISVGAQFVLYKPEGAFNYFFYDHRTGERVTGADLERAKILADAQGISTKGNPSKGFLYVEDATLVAWRQQNPGAVTRSMPDPPPLNAPRPVPSGLPDEPAPVPKINPAVQKEIDQAKNILANWDLYAPQIDQVRRLERGTKYVPDADVPKGYYRLEAVQGYRQLVNAYQVLEPVTPEQSAKLTRVSKILEGLEAEQQLLGESPTVQALQEYKESKLAALERDGEVFMLTGHKTHFNITRIKKMPDGTYTSTLYDSGHETRIVGDRDGRYIVNAVEENRIRKGTDIGELIEANVMKKAAPHGGPGYDAAKKFIENALEGPPIRVQEDYGQRRGNCTTRGQRIMFSDIMQDPKLSEGLYDFASNIDGTSRTQIREGLERKIAYLESIADGSDPANGWRQLDFENFAKANDLNNYQTVRIGLDSGEMMEVYRTAPGLFDEGELIALQGTLKRNGVNSAIRESVTRQGEFYLYVPSEDAPKISQVLANDNSPAADVFRRYGPNAREHIELRNFIKASDIANYESAQVPANGGGYVKAYRTKPGVFSQTELDALRNTLKRNGLNSFVRESTRDKGQFYLYVSEEDAPRLAKVLANDTSPAAQLYRQHGEKAVNFLQPVPDIPPVPDVPPVSPALNAKDLMNLGVWQDDMTRGGALITRIDARGMTPIQAEEVVAKLKEAGFTSAEVSPSQKMGGQTIRLTGGDALRLQSMRKDIIAGETWHQARAGNLSITRVRIDAMQPEDIAALQNALKSEGIDAVITPSSEFGGANTLRVSGTNNVNSVNDIRSQRGGGQFSPFSDTPSPDQISRPVVSGAVPNPATPVPRNANSRPPATIIMNGDAPIPSPNAADDVPNGSRFVKNAPLGRTAGILEELGASRKIVNGVDKTLKVGGKVTKGGLAGLGTLGAGFAIHERISGTGYNRLLEANGLDDRSSAVFSYKNYQDKNIADNVLLAVPAGVTQAVGTLSSGLRWVVGDVDHGKLLATVVARDELPANGRAKSEVDASVRNAVAQYADSAIWYFHHLTPQKRQNIIDNIMTMKESGRLQDWSQLPGLLGDSRNIGILQGNPRGEYFSLDGVRLPDAAKTREVFIREMGPEIQNAAEIEKSRQTANLPDIDWIAARERFKEGGAAALEKFLAGQFAPGMPSWDSMQQTFSKALDMLDADKSYQAMRNMWNRPLDSMTAAFVNIINGAKDGEDINRPMVLDENGKPRFLTDEDLQRLKSAQPDDPNAPNLKFLKVEKIDGRNVIVATDLTREELDKLQSGELKLPGAADMLAQVKTGSAHIESSGIVTDVPSATVEELRAKVDAIGMEKNPAERQRLQQEFNVMLAGTDPETQAAFIEQKRGEADDRAIAESIKDQKKLLGEVGPGNFDTEGLSRMEALNEKYKWYSTGVNHGTFEINGSRYRTYNTKMRADTNGNNRIDGDDDSVTVNITQDLNTGRKTLNVVNKSMFVPFVQNPDGTYSNEKMQITDPALLRQLQELSRKMDRERAKQEGQTEATTDRKSPSPGSTAPKR